MSRDKAETGERMGRPLGDLKGLTEQADEFALWLRKITHGVTVRTLERDFPHGKTSWSRFRDGSRLPPADLVEQVTARYVREPEMRKHQLEHGLRLLAAAERAGRALADQAGSPGAVLQEVRAPRHTDAVVLALRLDDARMLQFEATRKYEASERRREELETMVSVLEQRITILESERDRAREDVRAELQRELQMSQEYRRQAGERLQKAGQAVERARQLRLAADKQVAREQHELLRVEGSISGEVPPLTPRTTVAEELNLPPLHRFQEFLDANQQQMDALDDELDDLGRELGVDEAQNSPDDPAETRVVWGQVVDPEDPGGDVPRPGRDNSEKRLTGANATDMPREIGAGDVPARAAATQPQHSMSMELVVGLSTASTPDALAAALSQLRRRAGGHPIRELAAALPNDMRDDVLAAAVGRWMDGDDLPDSWPHLDALVRQMGATDNEAAAFEQAYRRIASSGFTEWSARNRDLADLVPFARNLWHLIGVDGASRPRTGEWAIAAVAPAAVLALTTAYTAAFQSSPRPGPYVLSVYGAVLLVGCLFALLITTRVAVLGARGGRTPLSKRFGAVSLVVSGLTASAGLVLPWLLDSDFPGRWLAHGIGLL
ncbi:hypothetical protein ACIP29_36920 [Streptomyces coelicoflavus]|uniref:hypothetical protein n=1 Tax=Streptomyces coelicoflavus TaxID=285562 RepID=UPI0038290114